MKLLTAKDRKALPPLRSQEQKGADAIIHVKFFNPTGAATWYATEFDGDDTFYGYVTGMAEDEFGYFSLSELAGIRGRFGLGIERDMYWTPRRVRDVMAAGR